MSKQSFTPGPWAYINPDGFTVRHPQVYSDTGPVCNATWLGVGRIDELQANARLIAAAPDLLEALCMLLDGVNTYAPEYMHGLPKKDYTRKALTAIAKATGA